MTTNNFLDTIPEVILPGEDHISTYEIKERLINLEKQEIVLHIASWLHQNELLLPQIDFQLSISNDQIWVEEDEVVLRGEITDRGFVLDQLHDLVSELDGMYDDTSKSLLRRLVVELNRAKWQMETCWQDLIEQAPLPKGVSGEQWLGAHRASWVAQGLMQTPDPGAASTSKRRM